MMATEIPEIALNNAGARYITGLNRYELEDADRFYGPDGPPQIGLWVYRLKDLLNWTMSPKGKRIIEEVKKEGHSEHYRAR